MASTAPSYRPAGGFVAPKGEGYGEDSSACVTVDNSPGSQSDRNIGSDYTYSVEDRDSWVHIVEQSSRGPRQRVLGYRKNRV
jgi:hypothetical protein